MVNTSRWKPPERGHELRAWLLWQVYTNTHTRTRARTRTYLDLDLPIVYSNDNDDSMR